MSTELFAHCPALMPLTRAAKESGISRSELYRWCRDGRLAYTWIGDNPDRNWRIRKDVLAAAIDNMPKVGE